MRMTRIRPTPVDGQLAGLYRLTLLLLGDPPGPGTRSILIERDPLFCSLMERRIRDAETPLFTGIADECDTPLTSRKANDK